MQAEIEERLSNLEHDNNILRAMLADVLTENVRLSRDFDEVKKKCDKLVSKVNEFVSRFTVVN